MKKTIPILCLALLLLAACAGSRKAGTVALTPDTAGEDSTSYELIVLDPGFETWFLTRSRPAWFHSQSYYESWNRQYVTEWNMKATSPRHSRIFETIIGYDPLVDYGLEINHKLFYYFQYVEKELGIPILPQGMSPVTGM
ncbi:MAG: hypothetical protein KA780_04990 [Prolixibacteraceae bacterium]|jgi:hypothetical protein|nr:hypothetical protein [Prolixibacteraceae bacterium]NLX28380.1 hypothetical protein [Bacteroidales bacterium]HNQ36802.1 DUF6146 family protein [Prolixibacteraceae bacterium]HPJ79572.1 DUF6146 family protein [Prolixibacteraceae bacterium]HRV87785.1 DUF6146 family protein [Prolixibacteraceae bacterium]